MPDDVKIDAELIKAGTACDLGSDPSKYLHTFNDWLEHHSLVADTVGIKDAKKVELLLLWGGKRLREISVKAGIVTATKAAEETAAATAAATAAGAAAPAAVEPTSYADAIKAIREECGRHVNRSAAMYALLHTEQGTRSFVDEYLVLQSN